MCFFLWLYDNLLHAYFCDYITTYFMCFFCDCFSCSSSLILCCSRVTPLESNTRVAERSWGRDPFTMYCIWCSFNVTTTSNSFSFCCFSSCERMQHISIMILLWVSWSCYILKVWADLLYCSVLYWLLSVTINDISHMHVDTTHRCAGKLKKLDIRLGSNTRHFVGFFDVPIQPSTRGQPLHNYSEIPHHGGLPALTFCNRSRIVLTIPNAVFKADIIYICLLKIFTFWSDQICAC